MNKENYNKFNPNNVKTIVIEKSNQINAGNYIVSIGTYNITDVAIISKSTGDFVEFKNIVKGGKLAKVKRKFKHWINNDTTFNFQFMPPNTTIELINFLRSK